MHTAGSSKVKVTIHDGVNGRTYRVSPEEFEILNQLASIYEQTDVQRVGSHTARLRRLLRHNAISRNASRLFGLWTS